MKYPYIEMQRNYRGGFSPVIEKDDNEYRVIYCCGCEKDVHARLTTGAEVYPRRDDLHKLPFWKCDMCRNTVGCHHKTDDQTRPLGIIATPEIKNARQHIHKVLDPLWCKGSGGKKDKKRRKEIYALISNKLGKEYHTAEIRTLEEARIIYKIVVAIREEKIEKAFKQYEKEKINGFK